jgi:peptidyl-prolyl cis-trans isomerase B (cyclophilin B)
MARENDTRNPERRSSACQFYIVWGKTYSTKELEAIQEKVMKNTNGQTNLSSEMFWTYRKVGGSPHLDGQYTVFGEVTEGLDVVERIQKAFTDSYNRPVDDIRILRATAK